MRFAASYPTGGDSRDVSSFASNSRSCSIGLKGVPMKKMIAVLLAAPLLIVTAQPASAQHDRRHGEFYNGAYQGGRNGRYDDNRRGRYNEAYDQQYRQSYDERYRRDQGGIGPGKGAAIGGAGGAVLGLLFGGGLKGALIGGAAGAGIGAVAGKVHQNSRRDRYDRPY